MSSSYALSYERFSAFIEQTLEVYRQELVALLFPLFVHSYLSLIVQVHLHVSHNESPLPLCMCLEIEMSFILDLAPLQFLFIFGAP